MIDRIPRKNEEIRFDSGGMSPSDGHIFTVMGKFRNYSEILNIKENGRDEHTQVIAKFIDGFNPYLHFVKEDER